MTMADTTKTKHAAGNYITFWRIFNFIEEYDLTNYLMLWKCIREIDIQEHYSMYVCKYFTRDRFLTCSYSST